MALGHKALAQRSMFFFIGFVIVLFSLISMPWMPGSVIEYNYMVLALALALGSFFMLSSYQGKFVPKRRT